MCLVYSKRIVMSRDIFVRLGQKKEAKMNYTPFSGRKNRKYTFEEKLEAAKMHVEEHIGCTTIANKFNCGKNRILLWSK